MIHNLQQRDDRRFSFPDCLPLVLAIFTCTFFYYRDFGFRMIYGYLALGLFFVLHLYDRLRHNEPLDLTPITMASAVLALMLLLQYLRPDARLDADTLSYLISMMVCIAYLLLASVRDRGMLRCEKTMYWASMVMAVFVVFFTFLPELFTALVYPHLSETARAYHDHFSPLGYGISLGGYSYTDYVLFLGMAVCCTSLIGTPRTMGRIAAYGASLLFLLLAVVTQGRRGELLASIVAIGVLVLALCSRRRRRQLLVGGVLLAAVMFGLMVLFLPQLKQIAVLERYIVTIENLLNGQDITTGRITLYRVAFQAFLEHPILGIGWDQFCTLVPANYLTNPVVTIEDAHCVYLQFLCETGIVGTVLMLTPIFYLLITTCRLLKAAKYMEDKTTLRFVSFSFLMQVFLLFLGLYDPSLQKVVFWCFYALALMFANAAMIRSGWRPTGPVSRALDALAPLGNRIFSILRTPWKEGK